MRKKQPFIYSLLFLTLWVLVLASCKESTNHNQTMSTPTLPDPLEAGWEGQSVCEVVEENDKLRILRCTFPPGVGHEKHYHPPHVGYTLAGGTFRIVDAQGTREVNVPTGYVFTNEDTVIHEVLNIGEATSQYLIIEYK